MEKSDSNIGLFFCSHSRPNSSEGSAKDERRMSEGKSASWHSRVCDEGKIKNQKFFWKLKKKLYLCPKLTLQ